MAANSNQFPALYIKGLKEVLIHNYKATEPVYSKIFHMGSMDGFSETMLTMAGIGRLEEYNSGEVPIPDMLTQGYTATFIRRKYGKLMEFEDDTIQDDRYAILGRNYAAAFGEAARNTEDKIAADIFNNAFSGSYLGPDAKALCATDHPMIRPRYGVTTWSNKAATSADLSTTALKNAIIEFERMVNEEGEYINEGPANLLVANEEWWNATEILKSMYIPSITSRDADTFARNNVNSMQGIVTPMKWAKLTDTDAWFLTSDRAKSQYGLKFLWRKKFNSRSWVDERTENRIFACNESFAVGWTDGRCVWGNPGA